MARSAIGWYVHYNAKNYLKYGTRPQKDGKEQSPEIQQYWNGVRKEIKNKIVTQNYNATEIKYIEDKLNAYRSMITLNDSKAMEKVRNHIISLLKKQFANIGSNTVIDWGRGDIYNLTPSAVNRNIQQLQQTQTNLTKNLTGTEVTYLNTVMAQFINAYNYANNAPVSNRQALLQTIQDIDKAFTAVIVAENQFIKSQHLPGIHTSKIAVTKDTAQRAVNELRQAMGLQDTASFAKAKGTFEEYVETAAALAAQGYSADAIIAHLDKVYQKKGGGHHTYGATYTGNMAAISKAVAAKLKKNDFIVKDANGEYKYKTQYNSEQKMDVEFIYNIHESSKRANLTIKNYNLYSSRALGLVASSPLSTFLFNMGDVDVTNHFLNILATHPTYPSLFKQCKTIAMEALGYYLLWAAMTGQGVGKTSGFADVFVVNNNKSPTGVKVWDIGMLINKIINGHSDYIIISPEKIKLVNTFVKGDNTGASIQTRLTQLIISAHSQKISVSLNPLALQI